jgi:anti-sigma B factor antagonist
MTAGGPSVLTVEVRTTEEGVDLVTLAGELDSSSTEPLSVALAGLAGGARRVVVDLAGLEFIDSSGVRLLVAAARAVEDGGGGFVLAAPAGSVRRVFQILHLDQVVRIVDDRAAAFREVTASRARAENHG